MKTESFLLKLWKPLDRFAIMFEAQTTYSKQKYGKKAIVNLFQVFWIKLQSICSMVN